MLVFSAKDSTLLIEFKIACGNIGLNCLVSRTIIHGSGNHLRPLVKDRFTKVFTQNYVSTLSRLIRIHYGWCCVCDELSMGVSKVSEETGNVKLLNRFDLLQHVHTVSSDENEEVFETTDVNPTCTYSVMSCNKNVANIKQRGLRIGTWVIPCQINTKNLTPSDLNKTS